ncbi:MAG: hypothetical protein WBI07_11305 [Mobilitalea sp.]
MIFTSAQNEAQNIITQLCALARIPVPQSYLSVEDESSVKNIDSQIEQKKQLIQNAINDKPTYVLPEMYRTNEQHIMSDEEYLSYLQYTGQVRQTQTIANVEELKRKKAMQKEMVRQQKVMQSDISRQEKAEQSDITRQGKTIQKEANHQQKVERIVQKPSLHIDYASIGTRVGRIIVSVFFWSFSIFYILFYLVAISTKGGVASGIVFLLTAILINPLLYKMICTKLYKIPRWVCVSILAVGFIIGIIMFPSSKANGNITNNKTSITTEKPDDANIGYVYVR